ncbi:MAG: hypothetical protein ACKVW3_12655 [Phycisphaerales bacterium]
MNLIKHAWFVYFALAGLAIAAVIIGETYKLAWVANWLAPILLLLCFVSLSTLSHRPDATARTTAGKVASYIRTTVFAVLIYLFIMIEIVSDAPVTLRLMGMSWTMSPHAASRVFTIGGVALVAIAVWVTQMEARRSAAAAALAENKRGQTPSVPPAAPTT